MGFITECRDAGIPEELLIPIRPPYLNHNTGEMDGGKAPAAPNSVGDWIGLHDWNKLTTPWAVKEDADAQGANAGLILGAPGNTPNGPVAFAALDIDLYEGQEIERDKLLNHLATSWPNSLLLVRETVAWRAMVLVRINDTFSTGRKTVYYLHHDDVEIGKIELLTTDQQTVIAGVHPTGGPMRWCVHGNLGKYRSTPIILDGMLAFDTFNELAEGIRANLEALLGVGYTYDSSSLGRGELVPDADLVPEWLTFDHLIKTIEQTPNPQENDRDQYVAFMEAVAATKYGMEVRHGPFTPDQLSKLIDKAADWATKWPGNAKVIDAYTAEKAKCENDWFKQRGSFATNWHRLTQLSGSFGYTGASLVSAQIAFSASTEDIKKKPIEPDKIINSGVRPDASFAVTAGDQTSDFAVTDYIAFMENRLDQIAAYIPEEKSWLVWSGQKNRWEKDATSEASLITWLVQQRIKSYTAKFGQNPNAPWTSAQINSTNSNRKVLAVTSCLSRELTKDESMISPKTHTLQTPQGTYDLRTLTMLDLPDRKRQYETRYTGVSPNFQEINTPLFDSLLYGLSDGNMDVVNWVWHYLGYCLLGDPRADCFLLIWGNGRNGKSVLLDLLEYILGSYHVPLNSEVLLARGRDKHPTSLNALRGKRIAVCSEMSAKDHWNIERLKMLTGGDSIQARNIGKDESTFKSEAGLLIVVNDVPQFGNVNTAIIRRLRMIGTTWQPESPDESLEEKIKMWEADAVLAKLMHYAQKVWNADGQAYEHIKLPPVPAAMLAESNAILKEADPIYGWIQAECEVGGQAADEYEDAVMLKDRFDAWLVRSGKGGGIVGDSTSDKSFKDALRRMGVKINDDNGVPLRKTMRSGPSVTTVTAVKGIRLKVKAVSNG